MGITIHYRGTMDDVNQIETMEDRVLDIVFAIGGRATIWRSFADHDTSRVVRGLIVEMEPGQDTFSLLVSPEGHLTSLFQIEDAQKKPFDEPPYCFVKTQFGSTQGHIAIVHLLDALRQKYFSNLYVSDEGEYYENRDIGQLTQKMQFLRSAISSLAEGMREHGLSSEAAEDPCIVATRVERIAALVHQKLLADQPPSNSLPQRDSEDDEWYEPSLEEDVAIMDQLRRKNDLRSERMTRRIAEATAAGMSTEEAFELAMQDEGLPVPSREATEQYESDDSFESAELEEQWLVSLSSTPFDDASQDKHPALEQAESFLDHVMDLTTNDSIRSSFVSVLARGSVNMVGGLAQATYDEFDNNFHRALAITQIKRALSGHAYARGAVFGLRSENSITQEQSKELHNRLESLQATIQQLAEQAWSTPSE